MQPLIDRFVGQYMTPPPMPPEAMPPGLLRTNPAVHAVMEIAWKSMGYQMLCNGMIIGAIATLAIVLGIICRTNIKAIIQGAIKSAIS